MRVTSPAPPAPPRTRTRKFLESPTPCTYLATWRGCLSTPRMTRSCSSPERRLSGESSPARFRNSLRTLVGCPFCSSCSSSCPGPFHVPSAQKMMFLGTARLLVGVGGRSASDGRPRQPSQHLVLVVVRVHARAVVAADRVWPVALERGPIGHPAVVRLRVVRRRMKRLGGAPVEGRPRD